MIGYLDQETLQFSREELLEELEIITDRKGMDEHCVNIIYMYGLQQLSSASKGILWDR